jgi:hypothetical protein
MSLCSVNEVLNSSNVTAELVQGGSRRIQGFRPFKAVHP